MTADGLTVLGGGTGTPMLLDGLRGSGRLDSSGLTVVANTADDVYVAGARVCPDVDTVLYTLADIVNRERWYGIRGDTTATHDRLGELSDGPPRGEAARREGLPHYPADDPFMTIGDRDRAVHLFRTALLERGRGLTRVIRALTDRLGISARVLPMTEDPVGSYVVTENEGTLHLQDYLVRHRARPRVLNVQHHGLEEARPADGVLEAFRAPVLIGPSNPVTSVQPILALPGVRETLSSTRVVAVSPFLGKQAFSGPAAAFMEVLGFEPTARGMARYYGDIVDEIILDERDETEPSLPVYRTDIRMNDARDRRRVAHRALERLAPAPTAGGEDTP